jgi:hypothetical protein
MSPLILAALVTDTFARIQCELFLVSWLSLGTIEILMTKVHFFKGGSISMLNGETGMRRKIGHEVHDAQ